MNFVAQESLFMSWYKRSDSLIAAIVLVVLLVSNSTGCHTPRSLLVHRVAEWREFGNLPIEDDPDCHSTIGLSESPGQVPWPNAGSPHQLSQAFLELAQELSDRSDARSTDYFFQAAMLGWQALTAPAAANECEPSVWTVYHSSLTGLIAAANRFKRIDQGCLRVYRPDGPQAISLEGTGLPMAVAEFTELRVVDRSHRRQLQRHYAAPGLGVPVVAISHRRQVAAPASSNSAEQFLPPAVPLAATIVLRPRGGGDQPEGTASPLDYVLELINPLQYQAIQLGQRQQPLARDISAPLEYLLDSKPSNPWTGFLLPGSETEDEGLKWLEPYQPGKIPVVFVHGLLSDPSTWMDMVNDLRAQPWFDRHYQVWGFRYATGSAFVTSALRLREQLNASRTIVDPLTQDPALQQMILVGHSMGGLVAKLQVTTSGDRIWNSISRVPLEAIQAPPEIKRNLAQRMYFTPQPFVTRVVYIATPHAGSSMAARGIGRASSLLVRRDPEQQARHRQLVQDNPDAFFGTFRRRIPSSVDLLEPEDCTLQTIYELPVARRVVQHSIVGTGQRLMSLTGSDGVVSYDSAHHPDSLTALHVPATHTEITRDTMTILEVARILQLHGSLQRSTAVGAAGGEAGNGAATIGTAL